MKCLLGSIPRVASGCDASQGPSLLSCDNARSRALMHVAAAKVRQQDV